MFTKLKGLDSHVSKRIFAMNIRKRIIETHLTNFPRNFRM